jgi:hypothetical protein
MTVILSVAKDLLAFAQLRTVLPAPLMGVLMVHIAAGLFAIVTGYTAVSTVKGGSLHRRAGLVFVYAMIVMGVLGSGIAAFEHKASSINGGLISAYFVVTALITVRAESATTRRLSIAAMVIALALAAFDFVLATRALANGKRFTEGVPVAVIVAFSVILLLSARGDWRVLREGIRGSRRIARHLWRMCFALFIAAGSFFIGQAHIVPKPIRFWPVLLTLAFFPLVAMAYWIWRIRIRQQLRGLVLTQPSLASAES